MLRGKKIILGVTGSISAYKSAYLIRALTTEGAEVKVIMSPSAKEFIAPLTLATLSKNEVYTRYVADKAAGKWNNHVQLGLWADVALIAPCTANTLSKLVSGACDNLLTAVCLSLKCPLFVAPAMDLDMFKHPATQHNLKTLNNRGVNIIPPESGELASGLHGEGRLAEPDNIVELLRDFFGQNRKLTGKKFIVTSGPTYESIDPVRFIGNHSSGKMGSAVADELADQGAEVHIIAGPGNHLPQNSSVQVTRVQSAREMLDEAEKLYPDCDGAVFAAAVSDYRPAERSDRKIKKEKGIPEILLKKNPDIAEELGKLKKKGQINVGFALETDDQKQNAEKKLRKKNFDFIVLNSPGKDSGFEHDTNKITIISYNKSREFELKSKADAAKDIVDEIADLYH